ncbi:MAG: YitT family protein [Erysipelotrichaceae bacterium]|nr:YitT family protein [Erysipelotrichaceae bacterium]
MNKLKLWWGKLENRRHVINLSLVIFGTFLVALGTGMFLTPNINMAELGKFEGINAGGMGGLGLIFQNLIGLPVDVTVAILSVSLFLLGLLILGKEFALKTLLATILYPALLSITIRTPFFQIAARALYDTLGADLPNLANILIGGLIGGVLVGAGVGLTFLGGGSTGGIDIFAIIINKYTKVKAATATFIIDAIIVFTGIFVMGVDYIVIGIIGIITAFITGLAINFVFSGKSDMYDARIISKEWEKINVYIQDVMERGATITTVEGGYKFEQYRQINVVFSREQHASFIEAVAEIDSRAFIVISQLQNVYGEGFSALEQERLRKLGLRRKKQKVNQGSEQ